jgi:hypothetical protein
MGLHVRRLWAAVVVGLTGSVRMIAALPSLPEYHALFVDLPKSVRFRFTSLHFKG